MNIVFMGTPDFAVPVLRALIDSGYSIAGVYTAPDKPRGRGQGLAISPVKKLALSCKLPLFQPPGLRSSGEVDALRALSPELIVVAAYGLILPRDVLAAPRRGCLNVHPSLLPRYRGPSPVSAAILAGESTTGVTIMLLDEGMDTGPVLARKEEPVLPEDTTGSLTERLAGLGAHLLLETIPLWAAGKITPAPQDNSRASYSKTLRKEDGEIDWSDHAERISRQVRAFQPWPGSYTFWKGKRLNVRQVSLAASGDTAAAPPPGVAQASLPVRSPLPVQVSLPVQSPPRDRGGPPGTVISVPTETGDLPGVLTGDGVLVLRRLQLEGKKEMSGQEFLRGQRDFTGSVLSGRL
ncbi:MAG: methionyl-tRNA formyltransferase [Chloroflexi bacterium]|nr:methionyl-tRNA formyltransferase [Chloroflexota bacterium]